MRATCCRLRQRGAPVCAAAAVDAAAPLSAFPLAEYPFPRQRSRTLTLFSDSFEQVLSHLASGAGGPGSAFLQCSSQHRSGRATHTRLAASTWERIHSAIPRQHASLLMFVKHLDDPVAFCGQGGATPCERPATGDVTLHGTAGDCCDDAAPHHPDPSHHADAGHADAQAAARRVAENPDVRLDEACSQDHGLSVRYYGLVAQSGAAKQLSDGCYLVKTVTQRGAAACHCMHYSLMRVCQGSALADEARRFWTTEM